MSDVKVTDLPSLSSADNDDVLMIIDVDADVTKKIKTQDLLAGLSSANGSVDSATVLSIITDADLLLTNILDSADGVVVSGPLTAENYIDVDGVKISSSVDSSASIILRSDSSGYVGIGIGPQETIETNLQVGGSGVTASNLEVLQTVVLSGLPTSDPSFPGQLWNDSGVLKISAG